MGAFDLKESMEEVRRRNEPKLAVMVMRLNSQNKSVVVMITPHGEDTIELHHHWEEIILASVWKRDKNRSEGLGGQRQEEAMATWSLMMRMQWTRSCCWASMSSRE